MSPRPSCIKYPIRGNVWWLTSKGGIPMINGSRLAYFYDELDSFFKILVAVVIWTPLSIVQLLTFVPFLLWTLVFDPLMILWTLLGMFLYQTKLLALTPVWNVWVSRWVGSNNHDRYMKKGRIDTNMLNKSLFHEIMFESLPQIIIQFTNGTLMRQFTPIGYVSISISILFALCNLYLYVKKTSFENVPTFPAIPTELLADYCLQRSEKMNVNSMNEVDSGSSEGLGDIDGFEVGNIMHGIEMKRLSSSSSNKGVKIEEGGAGISSSIGSKRDYSSIYAHLMKASTATDHNSVLQYLSDLGVEEADDLKRLTEAQFNRLLDYQKLVPREKLMLMLKI